MSKSKTNYPEIDDIRQDLDSLKNNVVELTKHVQKDGNAKTQELKTYLAAQLADLQKSGYKNYESMEKHVKDKPGQSMAIAFAAGLFACMMLRRR